MNSFVRVMQSSIGAKQVMAVTGLGLVLYVIAHMLGNLQVFLGPDALNAYGAKLHAVPGFLWGARAGLLVLLILHVIAAVRVTRLNRAARPERYVKNESQEASYAARTLMWSGVLIVAYVVYHLMHFTIRNVHTEFSHFRDAQGHHDVYRMLVGSFQNPAIAVAYVVAMVLLGMHLSHGIGSFLQTLGFAHPRYNAGIRLLGPVMAIIIVVGYISIPIAVLLGLVEMPSGGL
ncbi:MAG: succinate dehydrogenase cytochrome b subunit [Candidatus Krumholzibacteriia bacterium]